MADKSSRKPPLYYIQKFTSKQAKLNALSSWMLREIAAYLDLEDFCSFAQTCVKFMKLAKDSDLPLTARLSVDCLEPEAPSIDNYSEALFVSKLKEEDFEPLAQILHEEALQSLFYYNPKRKLLYSIFQDQLIVSKLRDEGLPTMVKSVQVVPDVKRAQGFGKQFYFTSPLSLMSLHEGPIEGLPFDEVEGWSFDVIQFPYEEDQQLEILDAGRTVIVGQDTEITVLNYKLEPTNALMARRGFKLFVPVTSAQVFLVSDTHNLTMHRSYPSDYINLLEDIEGAVIQKVEAFKYKENHTLVYLCDDSLMVNKYELHSATSFSTYKNFIFSHYTSHIEVTDMAKSAVAERLSVELEGAAVQWMHATNYMLALVYSVKMHTTQHYLGVLPHHTDRLLVYSIPIDSYLETYDKGELLAIKGYRVIEDCGLVRVPVTLLYNLKAIASTKQLRSTRL